MPARYASVKAQALLAREVSNAIAEEMEKQGIPLNRELVDAAHLARPMFRHLGIGSTQNVGATKELRHTLVTKEYLRRVLDAKELSTMVTKYYSLGKPGVLPHLRTEEIPFLIGGYMTWGDEKNGEWKHSVQTPEQILGLNLRQIEEKRLPQETAESRRKFLQEEYSNGVLPLARWLAERGINLSKIAEKINQSRNK
ncbi:hypothetical protein H0O03_04350 [Candidatus Micrarchaeota archaeon]|nr:hypothetical protein [Candidatus Micrarchaeota archaeon]